MTSMKGTVESRIDGLTAPVSSRRRAWGDRRRRGQRREGGGEELNKGEDGALPTQCPLTPSLGA